MNHEGDADTDDDRDQDPQDLEADAQTQTKTADFLFAQLVLWMREAQCVFVFELLSLGLKES